MKLHRFLLAFFCVGIAPAYGVCLNNLTREAPDERYLVEAHTVTDLYTGLMWMRCPLGQVWQEDNGRCQLDLSRERQFTWPQALEVAADYAHGEYTDWRLPNKNELNSLVDRACTGPAINENVFPDTVLGGFWTSTPARHSDDFAWQVNFTTGTIIAFDITQTFSLRLVREP